MSARRRKLRCVHGQDVIAVGILVANNDMQATKSPRIEFWLLSRDDFLINWLTCSGVGKAVDHSDEAQNAARIVCLA